MIDADDLISRLQGYATQRTPALASGSAVLAVSGGADSVATAALLCESGIVRPARCVVAHFDHRLRAAEAGEADRAAAAAVAARYGLALETGAWEEPRGGEAAARDARYGFLAGVAHARGPGVIVTGHTSDDQAETVIMRTLRGAGLRGLGGMAPQREMGGGDGLTLARPSLCMSRAETRAYCAANDLTYHDDATNEDRGRLRNRVRLDLLPHMEMVAPGARAAILRVAEDARAGVAALDAMAAAAFGEAATEVTARSIALSRDLLRVLPDAVLPYVWRLAIVRLLGDAREFDGRHYVLMGRASRSSTGAMFELPRAIRLTVDADVIIVSIGAMVEAVIPAGVERELPFAGVLGAWRVSVAPAGAGAARAGENIVLPVDAVVRGWRPGDRIQPRGMRGHKKLQEYYVDRKVARRDRRAAPIIACSSDVVWTPFGRAQGELTGAPFWVHTERVNPA